jgi:hypothetical protein
LKGFTKKNEIFQARGKGRRMKEGRKGETNQIKMKKMMELGISKRGETEERQKER